MKEVGPEQYRALHLVDTDGGASGRRGVNPSSPIAALLASLVVSAHGGADRRPATVQMAAATDQRDSGSNGSRGLATVDALRIRWLRAIVHDDTVELGALLADHPQMGLADRVTENGKSALMVAAMADDLPLAQALVQGGAVVGARMSTGFTAMMFTAFGEQLEVACWLHQHGGLLDDVGSNGWTALTIAAARGFEPMVDWLLANGADPDPVDIDGFTPLLRAVENGHPEVVSRLLRNQGIDIDHVDDSGNTALHHAILAQHHDLLGALLAAGASTALANSAGYTAFGLVDDDPRLKDLLSRAI